MNTPIYDRLVRDFAGQAGRDYVNARLRVVACPHCRATSVEPCHTPSGRVLPGFNHRARAVPWRP